MTNEERDIFVFRVSELAMNGSLALSSILAKESPDSTDDPIQQWAAIFYKGYESAEDDEQAVLCQGIGPTLQYCVAEVWRQVTGGDEVKALTPDPTEPDAIISELVAERAGDDPPRPDA